MFYKIGFPALKEIHCRHSYIWTSKQHTYWYSPSAVIHEGRAFKTLAVIIIKLKTVILQTPEPRQRKKSTNIHMHEIIFFPLLKHFFSHYYSRKWATGLLLVENPVPKHDDWHTSAAWLLNCPLLQYWHDFSGLNQITECQDHRMTALVSNGN